MDHAGAAKACAAAKFGSGQVEPLTEHPQKRRLGWRISRCFSAVHSELCCHPVPPEPKTKPYTEAISRHVVNARYFTHRLIQNPYAFPNNAPVQQLVRVPELASPAS